MDEILESQDVIVRIIRDGENYFLNICLEYKKIKIFEIMTISI